MSSGSLKDLTKAVTSAILKPSLPLPEDLIQIIIAYLEKHSDHENSDAQRLHEELLSIYQKDVVDKPFRLASFLAILRHLKQGIAGSERVLQWWDKLSTPVLSQLGEQKNLSAEARDTLLDILVYDEVQEEVDDAIATSKVVAEKLFIVWIAKTSLFAEFDPESRFVENHVQLILLAFGKRRPKGFLNTINKFFVKKESRIVALSLLCEFFRHQPPHLHQLLETPLFDNLLRCLQVDTSTRVISLAMTALIMFLPHIPSSLVPSLPALFNIYTRMLFWDRERREPTRPVTSDDSDDGNEKKPHVPDHKWDKLPYILESDDETVPELLHYFTFLYGLYPINFMSYIRKPQRYLRHANFPGADDLDIQPSEVRQRSETFRQVHLLHENFFMMTIESELTDTNRWTSSEANDVVAGCMALYTPGDSDMGPPTRSRTQNSTKVHDLNLDVPEQPLMEQDLSAQSRHTSWRNTQSTAVASPDGTRHSGLHRKVSQTSQSMASVAGSPRIRPVDHVDRTDSPTLPPEMVSSSSHTQLQSLLNTQRSTRGSMYQTLTNDSIQSLTLSHSAHDAPSHVDSYLQSLAREPTARSPSLRPVSGDKALKVLYLEREIMLLKNDLNFERYLKQQHLSHIGQLRRKLIREARVEAETQNLINSHRALRNKFDDAKKVNIQLKKESEKSRTHSRKWEANLTTKLRTIREEQKRWSAERDQLQADLAITRDDYYKLRQIVVEAEAKELNANQKMQSIEMNLDELDHLRTEVDRLTVSVRGYEADEYEAKQAKVNEEEALKTVEILNMKLLAQDAELAKSKKAFDEELALIHPKFTEKWKHRAGNETIQEVIEDAAAASKARIAELQKAHTHLLKRYTSLESSYLELKTHYSTIQDPNEPLFPGGLSRTNSPSPNEYRRRQHVLSDSEMRDGTYRTSNSPGPISFPVRSVKVDTHGSGTPTSPDGRSPSTAMFQSQHLFSSSSRGSMDGDSANGDARIKPHSEIRVFGRGGVQNIGKKEKDKDKDKKDKSKEGRDGDKKEKKGGALRGIRSLV
ncbi:hypothetical protein B7494_g2885 [Chlorociboria aeruginascens]|nr:hypothetical protein B7494_g2885 [Chlorociboria aeruginascens]